MPPQSPRKSPPTPAQHPQWALLHPHADLGRIPSFLFCDDPRSAREQFDERYAFGGGWRPMPHWQYDKETRAIAYPGDPPLHPIAETTLRDELILLYPSAWVAIIQPDGAFEVARMD